MSAAIAASAKATERSPQGKPMPMPSSARLADLGQDRARFGMMELDAGAERGPGVGLEEGARGRDVAQGGRGGVLGDQHAHPAAAPARRHAGSSVESCRRGHASLSLFEWTT